MDPVVERAQRGDPAALSSVLADVAPLVLRFGRRMCRNDVDAEDVVQDTLISIATNLPEFQGRSSLSSWVFTLARTACVRRRRGAKNQPHLSDDALADVAGSVDPEVDAGRRELGEALERALAALPEDQREVVVLRDVEGLSAAEAAEAIGISVEALKSRLHRARTALRVALGSALDPRPAEVRPGCPDVAAMLSRKLEGELAADDCARMEAHLVSCPACSAECDALRRALSSCRAAATPVADAEVKAAVARALDAWVARHAATPR